MEVKRHFKLLWMSIKYNLIKSMDNRVSFIFQVLGMILNNATMIIQWVVLFSLRDSIGGYGFREVLLLWAISAGTFGVSRTIFYSAFNLSNLIITGKLDAFLVQPKDTLLYLSSSSMSVSGLGDILYGFILLVILKANILTWLLFIVFSICGGLILTSISIIGHSLTFWFNNMGEVATFMNNSMINFATYPDGIFDQKMRWLFLTILPIGFTTHIPVSVMSTFNGSLFITVILITILIMYMAYKIFNIGLKRYSSSNLMSARI